MQIRDRVKELRRIKASDLRPSPRNWRTHPKEQADALRGLLADMGFAGAVLVRELSDGGLELIDGHLRAETAPDTEIPVLVLDVNETEAAKLLATFDPLGAMAGVDTAKLDALLREVQTDNAAIQEKLNTLAHDNPIGLPEPCGGGDEFDLTPEENASTPTQVGDLWAIGANHRLLVGDCTVAANVGRLMNGMQPFIMVTDPPYVVEYDPGWRTEAAEKGLISFAARREGTVANDGRVDWTDAYRLFAGSVAYVWHAGRHSAALAEHLEAAGLLIRSQIIWRKPAFAISRGHYHWQHEHAGTLTAMAIRLVGVAIVPSQPCGRSLTGSTTKTRTNTVRRSRSSVWLAQSATTVPRATSCTTPFLAVEPHSLPRIA